MKSLFILASVLIFRIFLDGAPLQGVYISGGLHHASGREYTFECVSDSDGFCYVDIGNLTGFVRGDIVFDSWGSQEVLFLAKPDSEIAFLFDLNQMTSITENQPYAAPEIGVLDVERIEKQAQKTAENVANATNLRSFRVALLLVFIGGMILAGWILYNRIRYEQQN